LKRRGDDVGKNAAGGSYMGEPSNSQGRSQADRKEQYYMWGKRKKGILPKLEVKKAEHPRRLENLSKERVCWDQKKKKKLGEGIQKSEFKKGEKAFL